MRQQRTDNPENPLGESTDLSIMDFKSTNWAKSGFFLVMSDRADCETLFSGIVN